MTFLRSRAAHHSGALSALDQVIITLINVATFSLKSFVFLEGEQVYGGRGLENILHSWY